MTPRSVRQTPKISRETADTAYEALFDKGSRHLDDGRVSDAIECFEAALAMRPAPERQAAILFALANAARRIGHVRAAEDFYGRVLAIEPGRREALANLSNLLRAGGRYREAQVLLGEALEADPGAPELWLSLGHVMRETGDLERARLFFEEALRLEPVNPLALGSLADVRADLGEHEAALSHFDAALALAPHNPRLHYHRGLLRLACGRLEEGWADHAHRFAAAYPPVRYGHDLPLWEGTPLPSRTLLIAAEQGLGDQLIFASLIGRAMNQARPGRVIIECEARLVPLFARSFPAAHVQALSLTENAGVRTLTYDELDADVAVPMGDLPRLFLPHRDEAPGTKAYLKVDELESGRWHTWLRSLGPGPYIGLCWRSGKMSGLRRQQFASPAAWAHFARGLPGSLICVQYDGTPEERAHLAEASGRDIHTPPNLDQKNELDRSAALLSALNAVVAAPTAVSALAASVGTTTLKLLYDTSWTALGADIEPLAPACRLIRPTTPGHWPEVFARAKAALSTF